MQPIFSLAYTSIRANRIPEVVNEWLAKATNSDTVEVVICVDANSPACIQAANLIPGAKVVIQEDMPGTCVKGWNKAAENTTGKVIICVADDFRPPVGWDTHLLSLNPKGWVDGEYVIHVDDGYVHDIFVLSILTRKRYEKFGYVFYIDYESLFADTEFTTVAKQEGVVIEAAHLLFEHMHPDCGKRARDGVDEVHASKERWNRGQMLFTYRMQQGFPVDAGPKAGMVEVKKVERFAAYIQANKDDFCLLEVCVRLVEEGVNDFYFCIPDEYWSEKVTSPEDIKEVTDVAYKLNLKGCNAKYQVFEVKNYRQHGDTRIMTETRLRNDALAWIRKDGFQHILVVDGDELWMRGTFNQLVSVIATSQPFSVSCPMIPTIGLPGYPIEGAIDRAVVYLGKGCGLRDCRTPLEPPYMLNGGKIVHFTATRKTMDEIIQKHRESGHYDDPAYRFEEWIRNVLPNAKPGFHYRWNNGETGAHMWVAGKNIWPAIRAWRPEEIKDIPQSLHSYIGL